VHGCEDKSRVSFTAVHKIYMFVPFSGLFTAHWKEYSAVQETLVFYQSLDWKMSSLQHCSRQQQQEQQQQPLRLHKCENCGKTYKQRNALWRHFKYECGKSPRFQCPYCRYRSKQRSNMYSHVKHRHRGLKIYAIDLEEKN